MTTGPRRFSESIEQVDRENLTQRRRGARLFQLLVSLRLCALAPWRADFSSRLPGIRTRDTGSGDHVSLGIES